LCKSTVNNQKSKVMHIYIKRIINSSDESRTRCLWINHKKTKVIHKSINIYRGYVDMLGKLLSYQHVLL